MFRQIPYTPNWDKVLQQASTVPYNYQHSPLLNKRQALPQLKTEQRAESKAHQAHTFLED